ncbi:hypothetical protein HOG17_04625 [Candidatus Peregrinibacteria bacterium]|nr:hypothetical protein [Candidatus Peregrinibacteria bacterium]MBT4456322.1 hypothetical protein [Candidatus Peregrinibacteria bacterium]
MLRRPFGRSASPDIGETDQPTPQPQDQQEREIQSHDVLCQTAAEVAEKVEALGLDNGSLETIALAEGPVAATQIAIRLIVQQRAFMDDPNTPHKMLMQAGVLRNESLFA